MAEVVELVGGPADGKRIGVLHGDIVRMVRYQPACLSAAVSADEPPAPGFFEEIEYWRSAKNARRFIFQPSVRDGLADRAAATPLSKV